MARSGPLSLSGWHITALSTTPTHNSGVTASTNRQPPRSARRRSAIERRDKHAHLASHRTVDACRSQSDNANLFVALRAGFPADLDATAIETADGEPLATAGTMSTGRARASPTCSIRSSCRKARASRCRPKSRSRRCCCTWRVLRAGHVFLPLNTAYQASEIEYFIGNAEPSVVVCSGKNFGWVSRIAFSAGTAPCLHAQRRPQRIAARARRAPRATSTGRRSAAPTTWRRSSTPAAPPGAARARCSATATCCRMRAR